MMLLGVRLALKTVGFRRTFALATALPARPVRDFSLDMAARQSQAVADAAAFLPIRARCLEQSLVLLVRLRLGGAPARLRIGVTIRPFRAHAWVEINGHPVNSREEEVRILLPVEGWA
jgi:transglutaminase-like putative cysteine protease